MDADLGSVSYETQQSNFLEGQAPRYIERSYFEATAEAMDDAVREVLREVSGQALEILTANRDILDRAAARLLEVETLDETALQELTKGLRAQAKLTPKVVMND